MYRTIVTVHPNLFDNDFFTGLPTCKEGFVSNQSSPLPQRVRCEATQFAVAANNQDEVGHTVRLIAAAKANVQGRFTAL